jgi:hypothetical protein
VHANTSVCTLCQINFLVTMSGVYGRRRFYLVGLNNISDYMTLNIRVIMNVGLEEMQPWSILRNTPVQVPLVIRGGCVPVNRRVYRKRVKRETHNMPIDFLSDTQ